MIYGFAKFSRIAKFDYVESLLFGALISATDPGKCSLCYGYTRDYYMAELLGCHQGFFVGSIEKVTRILCVEDSLPHYHTMFGDLKSPVKSSPQYTGSGIFEEIFLVPKRSGNC